MWTYVFLSLEYILRNGIAGSCENCIFNLLRNCQSFLVAVPFFFFFPFAPGMQEGSNFSTPSPTLVIICLFYYSILVGVKWSLRGLGHCILGS